jgi:phosphatidylserine/phosphatidylglycerophosphate/cardiolipin synthase-like enzyme/uncharacterized membrane protein YdjX (TVP38/TMEM64 family)
MTSGPENSSSSNAPSSASIIRPGHNCWKRVRAGRLSVLIDGQSYFAAVRKAIQAAQNSIEILAWDIDPRVALVRDDPGDGFPVALGEFFVAVLRRRPRLRVRILEWDFSMIYAVEREWVPLFNKPRWPRHPRLDFRFDGNHPVAASHHQKLVVVDDRTAFVGGMDLSKWRWDSPRHLADDPRRIDPGGDCYPPYHDIQVALDGEAAHALGELARERWRRATGETIEVRPSEGASPWPADSAADFRDVEVAIARTDPPHDGRREVREVENLTLDAIRRAEFSIYIENQFFTSASVCEALEERLSSERGPDVVMLLPRKRTSWLEEYSMNLMRSRCLRRLKEADHFDRLRVYYPHVPGLDEQVMTVHAKLMIVDGRFLRVGSSNLTNRSMGLDTECDIAIDACDGRDVRDRIRKLQSTLLAHHLEVDVQDVQRSLHRHERLGPAVDELRTTEHRSFAPLHALSDERLEQALPESTFFDPERPLAPERLVEEIVGEDKRVPTARRLAIGGSLILVLIAMAAAWRWSPLADRIDPEVLAIGLARTSRTGWNLLLAPLGIALASILGIPVSVLVVAASLAFDGWRAIAHAWIGGVTGAMVTYALGRVLGRDLVRRLAGRRVNRLSRALRNHGLIAVIVLRIVPVAPFAVINLVMGASQIRFRHYLFGTMIGMLPGILAITIFVDRILVAFREATPRSWLIAIGAGSTFAVGLLTLRWLLTRRSDVNSGSA